MTIGMLVATAVYFGLWSVSAAIRDRNTISVVAAVIAAVAAGQAVTP